MRMNLNQQSFGHEWAVHKTFIANMPPLVDCGVHYVDVMCQMTRAKPKLVQGMAARVSDEIGPRTSTTTARCRWCSTTARWAGTRWAGGR